MLEITSIEQIKITQELPGAGRIVLDKQIKY